MLENQSLIEENLMSELQSGLMIADIMSIMVPYHQSQKDFECREKIVHMNYILL